MAGGEHGESREESPDSEKQAEPPQLATGGMELCDSLPGDRAVIAVESEGEFLWLASKKYVHPKAAAELEEQLQRIVGRGLWVQNWHGPQSA